MDIILHRAIAGKWQQGLPGMRVGDRQQSTEGMAEKHCTTHHRLNMLCSMEYTSRLSPRPWRAFGVTKLPCCLLERLFAPYRTQSMIPSHINKIHSSYNHKYQYYAAKLSSVTMYTVPPPLCHSSSSVYQHSMAFQPY